MSYQITVHHSTPHVVFELRRTVRADRAGEDIDNGMQALYELVAATGLTPAGAPSTTYLGEVAAGASTAVDFAMPVTSADAGTGEIFVRRKEPGLFARTTHRGDYRHIGQAYRALENWLRESEFQPVGPPTEVYLVAPDEAVSPRDLVTEIRIPVAPAALSVRLEMPFAEAVAEVRNALTEQGFGVLAEIDLQAKLDATSERHVVLAACNSDLAGRAIRVEGGTGLLICNVVVRTDAESTVVEAVDPDLVATQRKQPVLESIAAEARAGLSAVLRHVAERSVSSARDLNRA
ncbi:GyrI-like domain-containing protein [Nocardia xishanensis]|uniref:GyrI-like domain-containing protein n=1 Tax=Nocardia xishanensis TaxID=238964 RepID=A0ABW7X0X3_9NOCA